VRIEEFMYVRSDLKKYIYKDRSKIGLDSIKAKLLKDQIGSKSKE